MWKYTPIHSEQHSKEYQIGKHHAMMNRCLQETDIPKWMTKVKTILIQKDPQKGTSQQLQTHNMPTNDVGNTNSTKTLTVSRGKEKLPQVDQRYRRATPHESTHPQGMQDEMEKFNYGINWLQKGIWYGPTKQDNRLSKFHKIFGCHKFCRKYLGKLESQLMNRKEKLNWSENPERNLPRRITVTITICNSNYAT